MLIGVRKPPIGRRQWDRIQILSHAEDGFPKSSVGFLHFIIGSTLPPPSVRAGCAFDCEKHSGSSDRGRSAANWSTLLDTIVLIPLQAMLIASNQVPIGHLCRKPSGYALRCRDNVSSSGVCFCCQSYSTQESFYCLQVKPDPLMKLRLDICTIRI